MSRQFRPSAAISKYREYPAPASLHGHLMCLWTQSIIGAGESYAHRVLPDGCIDLVFINDEPPLVVGPYVECFIANLPPGATIVGARFRPGRAAGLLGHPASQTQTGGGGIMNEVQSGIESFQKASMGVGQYLSPNFYVSYGINTFDSTSTFGVRYQLTREFALRATSGANTNGIDLLYIKEFR